MSTHIDALDWRDKSLLSSLNVLERHETKASALAGGAVTSDSSLLQLSERSKGVGEALISGLPSQATDKQLAVGHVDVTRVNTRMRGALHGARSLRLTLAQSSEVARDIASLKHRKAKTRRESTTESVRKIQVILHLQSS